MRVPALLRLLLCLLPLWTALLCGQEGGAGRIAAVSDFENYSGDPRFAFMQKGIADAVINQLATLSGLMVVERQKLDSVMAELQLSQSGLMNDMTVQKVGRSLAAGLMIVGGFEYNGLTRQIRINARVVEIETGLIVYSDTVIDEETLADDLQKAIAEKIRNWFMFKFGLSPAEGFERVRLQPESSESADAPALLADTTDEPELWTNTPLKTVEEPPVETVPQPAGDDLPRPANLIERIRLMFTEMRIFQPSAKKEDAGSLADRVRSAGQPQGELK
jgi:TolB-like protein